MGKADPTADILTVDPAHRIGMTEQLPYRYRVIPGRNEGVEPMGRGRAKAKQTKVARELKYSSGGTDLDRLAQELAAERGSNGSAIIATSSTEEDDDEYGDYASYADDDEDEHAG
jgi:hypothetical protein